MCIRDSNQTYGVTVNAWYGEHSTVLGLLGDTAKIDIEYILSLRHS